MLAVSVSSLFVWRIDVTGNEALTTGQILRCLDACGVRPGTYWPGLSNDLVRNDMILRLPQLRWLTVNVRGQLRRGDRARKRTRAGHHARRYAR